MATMDLKAVLEREFPSGDGILQILEDNDVNMDVFLTMTEADLKEIGITSFGVRRKLKLLIEKLGIGSKLTDEAEQKNADTSCKMVADVHPVPPTKKLCTVSPGPSLALKLNLEEELGVSTDGEALVRQLKSGRRPTTAERQLLVRVAVAALVQRGDNGLWPTSSQKSELAKLMTETFPSTRDTSEGMSGHELFYHNGSGFIEYRLKTVRQKLLPEQMRRRRSSTQASQGTATHSKAYIEEDDNSDQEPDSRQQEMINWMKYTAPKKENKPQLLEYFKETHAVRRHYIETSRNSITDILERYPRFKDCSELINLEFGMMHREQQDNLISKWPLYREAILKVGAKEYPAIQDLIRTFEGGNVDLCGLSTLVYMLHHSVNKKTTKYGTISSSSRAGALQHLIQHKPEGTDVHAAVLQKESEYKQPYLLSIGREAKNPSQFFLVLDRLVIPGGLDIVPAFDRLFKAHYVFSANYSPVLQNFWEFIDCSVYSVMKPLEAKAKVRDMASAIRDAMTKK